MITGAKYNYKDRRPLDPLKIKDGQIVTFRWRMRSKWFNTGYACMMSPDFFYAAYNLYRQEEDGDGVCTDDFLPDDITLYAPTREEYHEAIKKLGKYITHYRPYRDDDNQADDNLKTQLADALKEIETLKATIAQLQARPTEDDFVERFVDETKHFFKHDRQKADVVRQIMIRVGRTDADEKLDAWIEGSEKPVVHIENAADVITEGGRKIVTHTKAAV